eukprot:7195614-Prymnesium_polylepis.3
MGPPRHLSPAGVARAQARFEILPCALGLDSNIAKGCYDPIKFVPERQVEACEVARSTRHATERDIGQTVRWALRRARREGHEANLVEGRRLEARESTSGEIGRASATIPYTV